MSCDFKDFQNYYLNKVIPKLQNELENSFKKNPTNLEEITGNITGNSLGADIVALSHYHKWLTENFDIKPKN